MNTQSIDGARRPWPTRSATSAPDDAVPDLPVPMRVEDAEQAQAGGRPGPRPAPRSAVPATTWRRRARPLLGDVEIPYKPFYAYEEILAAFGDRPGRQTSLLAAFERLARW